MPTMKTLAIVNEKGGSAKTTTAVNLAAGLARLGQRVVLVDLDGQAAASRWLGVVGDSRLAGALRTGRRVQAIPEQWPGVALVPACPELDAIAHELRPTQTGRLRQALEGMGADVAILDCPPGLGQKLVACGLLAASYVLIPVECSVMALDSLQNTLTDLDDLRTGLGHNIALAGILASRYDARTRLSVDVLGELRRAYPGKVLQAVVRETVRLRECPATNQSIFDHDPRGHGAEDFDTLSREIRKCLSA